MEAAKLSFGAMVVFIFPIENESQGAVLQVSQPHGHMVLVYHRKYWTLNYKVLYSHVLILSCGLIRLIKLIPSSTFLIRLDPCVETSEKLP